MFPKVINYKTYSFMKSNIFSVGTICCADKDFANNFAKSLACPI